MDILLLNKLIDKKSKMSEEEYDFIEKLIKKAKQFDLFTKGTIYFIE